VQGGLTLLGVVAIAIAASSMAGEYANGTLRNLLVREPRRARLLWGRSVAVCLFVAMGAVLGVVSGATTSVLVASARGLDVAPWLSSGGLVALAEGAGGTALALVGYALIGIVLGMLLRSPVPAVGVGVAYALPFETILYGAAPGVARWLPGQLLGAIAEGGTAEVSLAAALVLGGLYAAVAMGATLAAFARRDVTT
jgi:ABC-type transport system involved in multi-copper enzyme maturation permease subunit